MSRPCRHKTRAGVLLALAALATTASRSAAALWDDRVELFVAQSFDHDSNVFRLPEGVDGQTPGGAADPGDRFRRTTIGARFELPVGQQRVVGGVALTRDNYDQFALLDYDGNRGQLAWRWQAGRRADGQLGISDESIRGSFTNLQGGVQMRSLNFVDLEETFADVGYLLSPRFELRGTVGDRRQTNSAPELAVNDLELDRAGLALSYLTSAGNSAGLRLEYRTGAMPVPQLVGGVPVDNSFEQRTAIVAVEWAPSEQSQIDFGFGRVSRSFPQSAARDYSDWTYSLTWVWRPKVRFSLSALFEDAVSDREEVNVGFVVAERFVLSPEFSLTEKFRLAAHLEKSDRQHLGDPGLSAAGGGVVLETLRVGGLRLDWTPVPHLHFGVSWRKERRVSNLPFADFDAAITSIEIRASL